MGCAKIESGETHTKEQEDTEMEGAAIQMKKVLTDQEGERLELEYRLLEGFATLEQERVPTYGIGITGRNGEACAVSDISSDRSAVCALLHLLWEMDVTPISLQDIVQDYIEN